MTPENMDQIELQKATIGIEERRVSWSGMIWVGGKGWWEEFGGKNKNE